MNFNLDLLKNYGIDVYISNLADIKRPHLISVGNHVGIDSFFYITTAAEIGNHVHISAQVGVIGGEKSKLVMGNFTNISLGGKIICGSDEFLGEGLVSAPGVPLKYRDRVCLSEVIFEDFVNLGANVTVLPGVTLREGSVIGANSLVIRDTEPWSINYGSPAKKVGHRMRDKIVKYAESLGYNK